MYQVSSYHKLNFILLCENLISWKLCWFCRCWFSSEMHFFENSQKQQKVLSYFCIKNTKTNYYLKYNNRDENLIVQFTAYSQNYKQNLKLWSFQSHYLKPTWDFPKANPTIPKLFWQMFVYYLTKNASSPPPPSFCVPLVCIWIPTECLFLHFDG